MCLVNLLSEEPPDPFVTFEARALVLTTYVNRDTISRLRLKNGNVKMQDKCRTMARHIVNKGNIWVPSSSVPKEISKVGPQPRNLNFNNMNGWISRCLNESFTPLVQSLRSPEALGPFDGIPWCENAG